MKIKATLIIIFLLLLSYTAYPSHNEKSIDIVSDKRLPFSGISNTKNGGYTAGILRAMFKKDGYKRRCRIIPYARIIRMPEKWETDVASIPDFYKTMLFPKEKIGVVKYLFVVNKGDNWRYSVDSMEGRRLVILDTGNSLIYTTEI